MMPVRRSQNWLPSIFNDFWGDTWMERSNFTSPSINVIENGNEFRLEVAAPGMTKEDFSIGLNHENNMVISMEKKNENEQKQEGRYLRREFSYSKFQQTIVLPNNVNKEQISAHMENGILYITIPKVNMKDSPKAIRTIEIQ
ncbi:MAG: Hsp20/alpha crystallin family protein [Tannerellaceae bacterium]|nr:Hsp20/alpha crystallin family protein [Tannerellaceae bacterium]MCD8178147.1 Hsp20/alpha crystallin family protein [Tannerellaceae bacterium]